jgi:hypothetical protein
MAFELLIIDTKTNKVVKRFAIHWLIEYFQGKSISLTTSLSNYNLEQIVEYCQKEIQSMEEDIVSLKHTFNIEKTEILEKIQDSSNLCELYEIIRKIYLSREDFLYDSSEECYSYEEYMIELFRNFENEITPYILFGENLYRCEWSY